MRALLAAIRCPKGAVERNLAAHLRLLAQARAAGCELVLFPEMSLTGSADPAAQPEWLIGLDHPAVAALAEATGETGVGACFGVAERSPDGTPYIAQVFAAAGRVAGVQRKRHLGEDEEAFTPATEPVSDISGNSASSQPSALASVSSPRCTARFRSTSPLSHRMAASSARTLPPQPATVVRRQ